MLDRRLLLISILAGGFLLAPPRADSQQNVKVARVGYLSTLPAAVDAPNREAFRQGLRALGYVEGQNLAIEARHADGNAERLPGLAAEISRLNVDVIVAATTPAVRAAQQAAKATPVVMAFAGDPVGDGLISSLARPDRNTTGLSASVIEIAAKRVELLSAVVPRSSRVVLLAAPAASISMVSATESAGRALGMQVTTVRVRDARDVAHALAPGSSGRIDGVIVDLVVRQNAAQILELARSRRLPTVSGPREFAEEGGLLAYGPNYPDMFRRAATYVDKILRGTSPAELPVEQPTKFDMIVNLRTARALGLTIPPSLLTRADEVIR